MKDTDKPKASPRPRVNSDFPKHTLADAIRVVQAIEDHGAGKPMATLDVATAVDLSPGSSKFRDVLSAGHKYGLTTGTYKTATIALTASQLCNDISTITSALPRLAADPIDRSKSRMINGTVTPAASSASTAAVLEMPARLDPVRNEDGVTTANTTKQNANVARTPNPRTRGGRRRAAGVSTTPAVSVTLMVGDITCRRPRTRWTRDVRSR